MGRLYSWRWIAATLVVIGVGYGIASQIGRLLIVSGVMPMPSSLPSFLDPRSTLPQTIALSQAFGGLRGNWMAAVSFIILFFFNIIGEEFWWRGYILPRQELAFGKRAWLIHGILWAIFHAFKWWDIIGLLPVTLALAFVVSRLKNNTTGIVMHGIVNGIGGYLMPILLGTLGIGG